MNKLKEIYQWLDPALTPENLLPAVIGSVTAVITLLLGYVVQRRLQSTAANVQLEQQKQIRAAAVAELISSWISSNYDRDEVNRQLFEASLWLPEKESRELNNLFAHDDGVTARMVLASCRKIIQGKKDGMTNQDFTIMPPDNKRLHEDV